MRPLLRWLLVLAPLALAPLALASPARAEPCKGVVLPTQTRGIPTSLVELARDTVSQEAVRSGCVLVQGTVVTDMRRMLRLPSRPGAEEMARLARGLLADWVLSASLDSRTSPGKAVVTVTGYTAAGVRVEQGATVLADAMLLTVTRLARAVVGELGGRPTSRPTSQPAVVRPPTSQPASRPAVVEVQPILRPPPVALHATVPAQATAPAPASAPAPAPAPAPVQPAVVVKRPRAQTQLWLGGGLRGYYLRSWDRGGPVSELELGAMTDHYRIALLYRTYFGDQASHYLGGRAEVGPRWGPLRLSFGADAGLLFVPDTADALDMLVLNLHPASLVLTLGRLVLQLDALSLDLYVIPADPDVGREVDGLFGVSSGFTVGVTL